MIVTYCPNGSLGTLEEATFHALIEFIRNFENVVENLKHSVPMPVIHPSSSPFLYKALNIVVRIVVKNCIKGK